MPLFKRRLSAVDSAALYLVFLGRRPESEAFGKSFAGRKPKKAAVRFLSGQEFRWSIIKSLIDGTPLPHLELSTNDQQRIVNVVAKHYGGDKKKLNKLVGQPGKLFAEVLALPVLYSVLVNEFGHEPARQLLSSARSLSDEQKQRLKFSLDTVVGNTITGYALDQHAPKSGVQLGIVVNGLMVKACRTHKLRRDLQEIYGGDGLYGFEEEITLPIDVPIGAPANLSIVDMETGQTLIRNTRMFVSKVDELSFLKRIHHGLETVRKDMSDSANETKAFKRLERLLEETLEKISHYDRALVIPAQSFQLMTELVSRTPPEDGYSQQAIHLVFDTKTNQPIETDMASIFCHSSTQLFNPADQSLQKASPNDLVIWVTNGTQVDWDGVQQLQERGLKDNETDIFLLDYAVGDQPRFQSIFDMDHLLADNPYSTAIAIRKRTLTNLSNNTLKKASTPEAMAIALLLDYVAQNGCDKIKPAQRLVLQCEKGRENTISPSSQDRKITELVRGHYCLSDRLNAVDQLIDPFSGEKPFFRDVRWALDARKKLAVIIPTRDALDLIKPCVESLLVKADNLDCLDIIIVDNQSEDPNVLAWFDSISKEGVCRVLNYDLPFNWSAINNMAANATDADHLLFLNNDTIALSKGWDTRTLENLEREEIGALGARLLYEDGTIQHAGVILFENGVAVHEGASESPLVGGYFNRTCVPHQTAAVTGAYLATPKKLFEELGGFDAENLSVTFNDIDYCLRVREAGHTILYLPQITFNHLESKSRGYDYMSDEKRERAIKERAFMEEKWQHVLAEDPYYPPAFERQGRAFQYIDMRNARW